MSNPQQPELARSRKTPGQDPDAAAGVIEGQRDPGAEVPRGPVPPENQPGHHPAEEQDKPDLNAFAERLGVAESSDAAAQPAAEPPAPAGGTGTSPDAGAGAGKRRASVLPRVVAAVAAVATLVGLLITKQRRRRSR